MKFVFDALKLKAETATKTAELLTMHTQEVEHVHEYGSKARGIVTGKIVDIQNHPNADRLRIATIDLGKDIIDIVTGAPNIEVNQIVPVALPGATVIAVDHHDPSAQIDPSKTVIIQPTTLRGVESQGMICGADELGLSDVSALGVHVFEAHTPLGERVENLLPNTAIIETDDKGTAHRPDLLSYAGIEQELAAILDKPHTRESIIFPEKKTSHNFNISIEANQECSLLLAAKIDGMKTHQSPPEMQKFLQDNGVKVINLATDVTNFLMLREGTSSHAFDAKAIEGQKLCVRFATNEEKIMTLNHQTYSLKKDDLVIADGKKALDIAGIIGGVDSSVKDDSSDVIVTTAVFAAEQIRKTSRRLGIRTDASARFERGQSVHAAKQGFAHAIQMISDLSGGTVSLIDYAGSIDEHIKIIEFNVEGLNTFLGTTLDQAKIVNILQRLGYVIDVASTRIAATVPWWRTDVTTSADVYEDIARIYGYNTIGATIPILQGRTKTTREKTIEILRKSASSYLYEVETSSMVERGDDASVEIQNPIGGRKFVRQTFVPQLFDLTKRMVRQGYESYGCFEVGKTHRQSEKEIIEKTRFGLCMAVKPDQAKTTLGLILHRLHIPAEKIRFMPCPQTEDRMVKYDAVAKVYLDKVLLGHMCVESSRRKTFCAFKLYVDTLTECATFEPQFKPYSPYPSIKRDITLIIDTNQDIFPIIDRILRVETPEPIIESVPHVTNYTGSEIATDKKSITVAIVFRSDKRTLTDTEVNDIMNTITTMLQQNFQATIR